MKVLPIIILSVMILITGCASAPTDEEIQNADYGKPVNINDCINTAKTFLTSRLKDPSSVQFSEVTCRRGWLESVPLLGIPITYGYMFEGRRNAKNSFGAYVGFTPFRGVVRDDDDGDGAKVVIYCLVDREYDSCLIKYYHYDRNSWIP